MPTFNVTTKDTSFSATVDGITINVTTGSVIPVSFLGLSDTPNAYTPLYFPRVNEAGTAIEFVASSASVAWSAITGDQSVVNLSGFTNDSGFITGDDSDNITEGATNLFLTTAERAKLGFITVTQAVDLDQMETDIAALSTAITLRGTWDASSGSFPSGADSGYSYIVSIGGTVDGVEFTANDRIVAITDSASTTTYTGNWHKLDYTDQVLSVAGKTGAVTLVEADITDLQSYLLNIVEDTTPQLGGNLDAQGNDITDLGDVTFQTGVSGGTLRTGTSAADKFVLQGYDTNDTTYRTVLEVDAGADVQLQVIADYLAIEDASDTTKKVLWDISGATASRSTTLDFNHTDNRTISFPDETGTLLTDTTTIYVPETIPAGAMKPATTNGAAIADVETTTNAVNFDAYDFDQATDESVHFHLALPDDWDGTNLKARIKWTTAATAGTGNVVWGIQAVTLGDSDVLDSAFGTAQTVTDAFITAGDMHIAEITTDIVPAGTWVAGDQVFFKLYRDADNVSDTYNQDARLISVELQIGKTISASELS